MQYLISRLCASTAEAIYSTYENTVHKTVTAWIGYALFQYRSPCIEGLVWEGGSEKCQSGKSIRRPRFEQATRQDVLQLQQSSTAHIMGVYLLSCWAVTWLALFEPLTEIQINITLSCPRTLVPHELGASSL
jgi:hypothetical protein